MPIPPHSYAQVQAAPQSVDAAAAAAKALKAGAMSPDFAIPDSEGRLIALKDLLATGPVVLVFYRGAWCPYCNRQLDGYQKALNRFKAKGATLVAVSPQLPEKGEEMARTHALAFPVLSDRGLKVARAFGLVFHAPANYTFLPEYNGDDSGELPLAATYVLGQDGRILKAFLDPDYKKRATVDELLEALPDFGR